jgi:hypothetical protein
MTDERAGGSGKGKGKRPSLLERTLRTLNIRGRGPMGGRKLEEAGNKPNDSGKLSK